jgi:hypothetical protein
LKQLAKKKGNQSTIADLILRFEGDGDDFLTLGSKSGA